MAKSKDDIGLDRGAQRGRQRTINADGSYNLERVGQDGSVFEIFHWLINTSWSRFWLSVFVFYSLINLFFAALYFKLGTGHFSGIQPSSAFFEFAQYFFFSVQTYTSVGYGGISPTSFSSGLVSSIEAFLGLMSFALATGTLYGRFSRPNAKLKYSIEAIVVPKMPYHNLQFMIANLRKSTLMEMEATMNVSWVEDVAGERLRKFAQLILEVNKISMFPTSWTINHIIDESSPLWGMSIDNLKQKDIEIFILIKGFDETFSQMIYSRHSYMADEISWGKKFVKPFSISESGKLIMDIDKVGITEAF